jgi:hypothetical protein
MHSYVDKKNSCKKWVLQGSAREGWLGGVTTALMALMPLKAGARLRGGLRRGGSDGVVVKARAASEVELGGAGSGGRWWWSGRAQAVRR